MTNSKFCYQENQFWGECQPCTPEVFNQIVDSADVDRKISIRQAVDAAISMGSPLDEWLQNPEFKKFCATQEAKPRAGATFKELTPQQKLLQITQYQPSLLQILIQESIKLLQVMFPSPQGHPPRTHLPLYREKNTTVPL